MARKRRWTLSLVLGFVISMLVLAVAPGAGFAQSATPPSGEPDITAASAIVVEYPSGRILYQKSSHDRMPPASLTKIMTAILALEYGNLNDVITVMPEDLAGESTMGLVSGEQQTLHDLMYGMLLPSGNDAAMAIARYLGTRLGSNLPPTQDPVARFADMMNTRVSQLGLTDTHFITPHGLDSLGHYSSAYDLASLAWYALHIPTFNDIVKTVAYEAPGHSLLNTNEMLSRYDGADGIKTGWTDGCGLCLVTSATRNGHRLISVVLNAPQWYSDSTAILDYGFAQLAATPTDPKAEVLSIVKRDTVSWLLTNPASAPPVPVASPVAVAGVRPPLAQGGGTAAQTQQGAPGVSAPPARPASASGAAQNAPEAVQSALAATGSGGPNLLVFLVIFVVVAFACCVLALRLGLIQPAALVARARALSMRSTTFTGNVEPTGAPALPPRPRPAQARTLGGEAPLRSVPRVTGQTSLRRDPNLLASSEDDVALRIEHAVAHAAEGRQGSGMSEFVLALKAGAHIDVADLSEQYRLSAGAFLALSRAQVAVGKPEDARRTLLHGVLVMPGERMLRLALYQLPPTIEG
jgi:D-alanyl-D-alanine carboxypeptidase